MYFLTYICPECIECCSRQCSATSVTLHSITLRRSHRHHNFSLFLRYISDYESCFYYYGAFIVHFTINKDLTVPVTVSIIMCANDIDSCVCIDSYSFMHVKKCSKRKKAKLPAFQISFNPANHSSSLYNVACNCPVSDNRNDVRLELNTIAVASSSSSP